jgi:hypothetical protein
MPTGADGRRVPKSHGGGRPFSHLVMSAAFRLDNRPDRSAICLAQYWAAGNETPMFGSSCLKGVFLILCQVSVAYAIGSADSRSFDSFVESRDRIIRWASGFVAKKRDSITGFVNPEAPFGGIYHYVDERIIFGKTAHGEECALHIGKRLESGEWVFSFYLEYKKREIGSVSMLHKNLGFGDGAVLFEGYLVVQSQRTVSNIGDVTSLDLHTTPSSIALLGLEVYASGGILGEKSMLIFLDDEANIVQVTYRFINEPRIRDGRRVDPVTCHFYNVS